MNFVRYVLIERAPVKYVQNLVPETNSEDRHLSFRCEFQQIEIALIAVRTKFAAIFSQLRAVALGINIGKAAGQHNTIRYFDHPLCVIPVPQQGQPNWITSGPNYRIYVSVADVKLVIASMRAQIN